MTAGPTGRTEPGRLAGGESGAPALSEFWRVNASQLEATELANLLRALRKVAGTLGTNIGDVVYAGMSASPGDIVLDPEFVMGRYPVSPWKVDYLVGLVTHEALHAREWSGRVWSRAGEAGKDLDAREKVVLSKIIHVGEDIYVDSLCKGSVLGLYVRKARMAAMRDMESRLGNSDVSLDALVYLWWSSAWEEEGGRKDAAVYREVLGVLTEITPRLRAVAESGRGVAERCEMRLGLYLEALEGIRDAVAAWKILDARVPGAILGAGPGGRNTGGGGGGKGAGADALREVEEKLAEESGDITSLIRNVVDDPRQEVLPTCIWSLNMPALSVADERQASRIKAIIYRYSDRKVLLSRGLTSGRLDRRRLYRAAMNGACFMERQQVLEPSWSICLLIDASGSMGRGSSWRLVETAVATMHEAFRGSGNRLQAWAYYESHGVCVLTGLIRGDELMSVSPMGETPSGQAIIAAAHLMPGDRKRRLMIHVTDGACNAGCDVRYGIDYCGERGIQLITLGCGQEDRQVMLEQYGRSVQFIDHLSQLPSALEKLLKWAFQYGVSPGHGTKRQTHLPGMAVKPTG
ncbi:MAG: VWA domain-containing protein [Actinobacteria bacterium]|nr:VWA domain-containing protein [Actinomycetota bacterium]